jgi:hypothetical protein
MLAAAPVAGRCCGADRPWPTLPPSPLALRCSRLRCLDTCALLRPVAAPSRRLPPARCACVRYSRRAVQSISHPDSSPSHARRGGGGGGCRQVRAASDSAPCLPTPREEPPGIVYKDRSNARGVQRRSRALRRRRLRLALRRGGGGGGGGESQGRLEDAEDAGCSDGSGGAWWCARAREGVPPSAIRRGVVRDRRGVVRDPQRVGQGAAEGGAAYAPLGPARTH